LTIALARTVLAILLIWASGAATVSLLLPSGPRALRWGWAFWLGSGWLSLGLGTAALLGLPSAVGMAAPLAPLVLWSAHAWRRATEADSRGFLSFEPSDALLAALLLAFILPAVALALTTRIPAWDGYAVWHFKGRIFYIEDRVPLAYFHDPLTDYSQPGYPLHLPLVLAGVAKAAGRWEDSLLLLVSPAMYASVLLLLYGTLRLDLPRSAAAVIVAGIAGLPPLFGQVALGYADLPVALGVASMLAGLAWWFARDEPGAVAIAALSGGLTAWTKNEGLLLFLVVWAAAWAWAPRYNRSRRPLATGFVVGLAIAAAWHLFRLAADVPSHPYGVRSLSQFARVPEILEAIADQMMTFSRWGPVWVLAGIVVLVWPVLAPPAKSPGRFFASVLVASLAAVVGFYVLTPFDLTWQLAFSLDRLLMQLLPMAVLVVGAGVGAFLHNGLRKRHLQRMLRARELGGKTGAGDRT
jgi:hypothetical protein